MARNKYPEQTVEKILKIASELFMKDGYDNTSLDDIAVKCGVTKGAIYHHFASKEDLLMSMMEKAESQMDWFFEIKCNPKLNGIEKLRAILNHELKDMDKIKVDAIFQKGLNDPKILSKQLKLSIEGAAPLIEEIIREGIKDGSIQAKQPKQIAQVMLILTNIWINPGVFPVTKKETLEKVKFLNEMLIKLGVPIFEENLYETVENYLDKLKE